ncbi:hypothetical protein CEP54_003043 [Fusarium duplospermum]|uniref:Uncharacterized protein n=1 Tax=Fusarium duplospermum TaxID=1325734 RepID=A0A428QRU6_9HYPO|nr:hypothetical protein CEP54_003043 [Fusarium duplospermum]
MFLHSTGPPVFASPCQFDLSTARTVECTNGIKETWKKPAPGRNRKFIPESYNLVKGSKKRWERPPSNPKEIQSRTAGCHNAAKEAHKEVQLAESEWATTGVARLLFRRASIVFGPPFKAPQKPVEHAKDEAVLNDFADCDDKDLLGKWFHKTSLKTLEDAEDEIIEE